MVSGGYRPTAPQNNTGVSATGGNGSKDGQPNRPYTGFGYGQNQEINMQQAGAPMASAQGAGVISDAMPQDVADLTLLSESQRDYEPITTGVDAGAGAGSEVLPPQYRSDSRKVENEQILVQYLPDLVEAARIPNAPDSYKNFVNYLIGKLK